MVFPSKSSRQYSPRTFSRRTLQRIVFGGILACSFVFLAVKQEASQTLYHQPASSPSLLSLSSSSKKIAILVGGSFSRFLFNSTLNHVLRPLVQEEQHNVDYFLLLSTQPSAPAYRADLPYMNHLSWDPIFGSSSNIPTQQEIRTTITNSVQDTGAHLSSLRLVDTMNFTEARLEQKRQQALQLHPTEDEDLRFPMLDVREKALQRTANGNRNMLNLFYHLELLWNDLLQVEESTNTMYDYVIIFRDDALWLQHFSLNKLLESTTAADAYVLACDARVPAMLEPEINDHAIVIKRNKAEVVGRYYTSLLQADLDACSKSVRDVMGNKRGCNSEMILKWILQHNSIRVQQVSQSLIPFQRSVHVEQNDKIVTCFHKYCQSKEDPLIADESLKTCKSLTF